MSTWGIIALILFFILYGLTPTLIRKKRLEVNVAIIVMTIILIVLVWSMLSFGPLYFLTNQ